MQKHEIMEESKLVWNTLNIDGSSLSGKEKILCNQAMVQPALLLLHILFLKTTDLEAS